MKRILLIFPGPTMEVGERIKTRLTRMSERYCGTVLTAMSAPKALTIGNFEFRATKYHWKSKPLNLFTFPAWCLLHLAKRRLKGEKWDLVISYDPIKTGLIAVLAAAVSGGKFAPEVNGVYDSRANFLDMPQTWFTRLKYPLYIRLIRFVLSRADGIKLLFPEQIDNFKPYLRKKPVIHAFFDFVDIDQMRDLGEEKEVLFVGFPFWLKGVDLLIDAFKELAPEFPEWKLKILGWFKDKALLDGAMANHPQIYHHPPVFPREMAGHMGRCAFLVLPSRTEAMGRVLLEAMAASKPRIGAKVEGIPTVIEDGVDGFLFPPGDSRALAGKMRSLMSDADLRKRIGQNARRRADRDFNSDRYFELLFSFYDGVLNGNRREADV